MAKIKTQAVVGKRLPERRRKFKKEQITLLLMILPSIIMIAAFCYLPLTGWLYAFFDYRIGYKLSNCEFVGLANIKYAFKDTYILNVLGNTLILGILGLLGHPIACAVAISLSEIRSTRFKKIVQTIITLPNFIGWIVIYSMVFSLFSLDGLVTTAITKLTGVETTVTLLSNPDTAKAFMWILGLWKGVGYNAIIYFAALAGIDPELYDAAKVDGAGRWARIKYITIPGVMPTLMVLLIIGVGYILNNSFEQYYCFINPMVQREIEVLDFYVYRIGMIQNDIPLSTAVSMCKSFVSVALVFGVNKLAKKVTDQSII